MDLGLKGKVAMITGASRGLGRAMAMALAAEGVRLSLCARGAEALEATAAELKGAGHQVIAEAADINDAPQTEWTAAQAFRILQLAQIKFFHIGQIIFIR